MAIRGSRSASNRNPDADIELGYSEGHLGVFYKCIYNIFFIFVLNVNEQ